MPAAAPMHRAVRKTRNHRFISSRPLATGSCFVVDQSNLSPEAQTTLDGQAQWLMANPEFNAVIEGHADEQGTREYNVALGARRSNSVQEYLVSGAWHRTA